MKTEDLSVAALVAQTAPYLEPVVKAAVSLDGLPEDLQAEVREAQDKVMAMDDAGLLKFIAMEKDGAAVMCVQIIVPVKPELPVV